MDSQNIKFWHTDLTAPEVDYPHFWSLLDPSEKHHASTIKNERLHRRYVEVHAQLRLFLGETINAAPELLRIHKAEYGKPYLVDYPELAFNLSHTANRMAVAIAYKCDLGIDIEFCKPRTNLAALVEKCFAEEEKEYWQKLPSTKKTLTFYRFWTRKEAFVKATGRGIALGLKQCVIDPNNPTRLLRIPENYGHPSEWLIQDIGLFHSICGAIVIKSKD